MAPEPIADLIKKAMLAPFEQGSGLSKDAWDAIQAIANPADREKALALMVTVSMVRGLMEAVFDPGRGPEHLIRTTIMAPMMAHVRGLLADFLEQGPLRDLQLPPPP